MIAPIPGFIGKQGMIKEKLIYSNHAVQQMFKRDISTNAVEMVMENGEIIKSYPEDTPYPSYLLLGFYEQRPLHIVYSDNRINGCLIIITVYEPSTKIWKKNFKKRKK